MKADEEDIAADAVGTARVGCVARGSSRGSLLQVLHLYSAKLPSGKSRFSRSSH